MSQLFCKYCTPCKFSILFLKSTPLSVKLERLLKSEFYYPDYDDSIVESVFSFDYRDMMSLSCILPTNLAISISNILTRLLAQ